MDKPYRYHLFGGINYEPSGGMQDYCGSFHTREDAAVYVRGSVHQDWWELARTTEQGTLAAEFTWDKGENGVEDWQPTQ